MKTLRIATCVVVISFFVGCRGSESIVSPNANLNRYSYVAMVPLSEQESARIIGDSEEARSIGFFCNQYLTTLFRKEGLKVLPDFSAVETIPMEDSLQVLICDFSWQCSGSQCSASIFLLEGTEDVFSSNGRATGGKTIESRVMNALKPAFNEFRKRYSGFDPNLARDYAKALEVRYENCERIDINEVTLRGV